MSASSMPLLATRVHDLRSALGQHDVESGEVRAAARAVLQELTPLAARDTVEVVDPGATAPPPSPRGSATMPLDRGATWASDPSDTSGTWAPDATAVDGTWAPDPFGEAPDDDELEPTERIASRWDDELAEEPPLDLESCCRRLLAGTIDAPTARAALERWRPATGTADQAGRYLIARELGRGGMGQVLEADDAYLQRSVAIKVLTLGSQAARRRFVEEARLTARLSHPGVVPVHDVGLTPDGKPFFAMKRIQGRSLHDVVHTGRMPRLSERLDVFKRVCEAVAFAHDADVLHLDIKPDNVMIGDYGEVLVVDWGLAADISDGGAASRQVAGTPAYMAPEQARAGAPLDRRTDVYALGALLYELLTDQPPIPAGGITEMLERVRSHDIPPPRRVRSVVPAELDALVVRAMAADPADRPSAAMILRDEVQAFQENRELSVVSYGWLARLEKWRRRNRAMVTGVVATGAIATVLLVVSSVLFGVSVFRANQEAHAQARLAAERLAEVQLQLGKSYLNDGRVEEAEQAYLRSSELFGDLGLDDDRPWLGLSEARSRRSLVRAIPLPFSADQVHTDGERVLVGREHRWVVVDAASGEVTPGPEGATRGGLTPFGLAWWRPADDGGSLTAIDDTWSVHLPEGRLASIQGDHVYTRDPPRRYPIVDRGGITLGPSEPITFGPCDPTRWSAQSGPIARCDAGRIDVRSGEPVDIVGAVGSLDGDYILSTNSVQPVAVRRRDEHQLWTGAGGLPLATHAYPGGVAWITSDRRVLARRWSGEVERTWTITDMPSGGPYLAVAPDQGLAAVPVTDTLYLIQSRTLLAPSDDELEPRALASWGDHGLVAADEALRRWPVEGGNTPVRWRAIDLEDHPIRDVEWHPDGRLAVALRRHGVWVVRPDGTVEEHQLEGCCLGVAWRNDTLGAVGSGDTVYELNATWRSIPVEELGAGAWDLIARGDDGWVVSDYDKDDVLAFLLRDGVVEARLHAARPGHSFDLDALYGQVVVGSRHGAWLWDGADQAIQLTDQISIGVADTPTGPVVSDGNDQLLFFDREGRRLHAWHLGGLATHVTWDGGALYVNVTGEIQVLPIDLGP